MCTDLYRDPTHSQMVSLLVDYYKQFNISVYTEYRLTNNRRADIVFDVGPHVYIIEVKEALYSYHIESALKKYRSSCNFLYLATPQQRLPCPPAGAPLDYPDRLAGEVGVLSVGWDRVAKIREALYHQRADQLLPHGPAERRAKPLGVLVPARSANENKEPRLI